MEKGAEYTRLHGFLLGSGDVFHLLLLAFFPFLFRPWEAPSGRNRNEAGTGRSIPAGGGRRPWRQSIQAGCETNQTRPLGEGAITYCSRLVCQRREAWKPPALDLILVDQDVVRASINVDG